MAGVVIIFIVVAGVTENSPYWIYYKSCDEECHTKHNEEEVTQALVLGIVGQLGCLKEKKLTEVTVHNEFCVVLFFFFFLTFINPV